MFRERLRTWLRRQPPPSPAAARRFAALDVHLLRLIGRSLGGGLSGLPVLILTTTGRRSGRPRSTPLAYVLDGRDWIVVAGNRGAPADPLWLENLRFNPIVRVEVDGGGYVARATILDEAERARIWPRLRAEMPPIADYEERTTRCIPVVRLAAAPGSLPD